jgi:hypothetical protein
MEFNIVKNVTQVYPQNILVVDFKIVYLFAVQKHIHIRIHQTNTTINVEFVQTQSHFVFNV